MAKKTPLARGWPDRSSEGLYGELGCTGYRARNESMLTASTAKAPRRSAASLTVSGASLSFISIPFKSSTLAIGAACNRLTSMLMVNAVCSSQQSWNQNGMTGWDAAPRENSAVQEPGIDVDDAGRQHDPTGGDLGGQVDQHHPPTLINVVLRQAVAGRRGVKNTGPERGEAPGPRSCRPDGRGGYCGCGTILK